MILCYHAVSDRWPDPLAVPVRVFRDQLRALLSRGFRPVSAWESVTMTGKLFHVTFDDAYLNVLAVVPLLEQYRVPATVFVCSDFAAAGAPLLIPELTARARGFESDLVTMTWDTLRAIGERGCEIGAHSASHAHLSTLSDAELASELSLPRERIGDEIGRECAFLAYPFGEHDARVRQAAKAAGYAAAFGLRPIRQVAGDRHAVPRVDIYRGDGKLRFRLKTSRTNDVISPSLDLVRRVRHGGRGRR